jgi:hypothetical protein
LAGKNTGIGVDLEDGNEEIIDDGNVVEDVPLGELLRTKRRLSAKVAYIADFLIEEGRVEESAILHTAKTVLEKVDLAKTDHERRDEARIPVEVRGELDRASGRQACDVVDLSPNGAAIATDPALKLHERMRFRFEASGERAWAHVVVRWGRGHLAGVEILAASPGCRRRIAEVLHDARERMTDRGS